MKKISAISLFLCLVCSAHGQISCGITWPMKNSRIDTITTFLFINKSLKVANIQKAKVTSNFSFKTKFFSLVWMPIYTNNTNGFIARSLKTFKQYKVLDTLTCKIFDQDYTTIVMKSKKEIQLLMYSNQLGAQNIFISSIPNKRKLKQTIDYIESNLL